MEQHDPKTYGRKMAAVYDAWYPAAEPASIDFLAELGRGNRTLELGVGTGRVALALQERGVPVEGIDISPEMTARLKQKPGGSTMPVRIGDFAELPVDGLFDLIYVVFNTFFGLTTQQSQLRCFKNVARHLSPHGRFVMEAFVPDIGRFSGGQAVRAVDVGEAVIRLDVSKHNRLLQQVKSSQIVISENGMKVYPVTIRYAWPSELELMGQLAGLRLIERWGDWSKTPFTETSGRHVSVYSPPAEVEEGG